MVDTLLNNLPSQSGFVQIGKTKQWEDDFLSDDGQIQGIVQSTSTSPGVEEAVQDMAVSTSSTILTISLVSLSVILAIVALFALAIFIDFRQEKLANQKKINNKLRKRKSYPRINLPRCRRAQEDTTNITMRAEGPGISRPPLETIMEDV